ncbi:MAG: hypothetical protein OEV66_12795 [Spirochaetia bacterium]|nr:hypothetical protein [Spirochaetia bacterium]
MNKPDIVGMLESVGMTPPASGDYQNPVPYYLSSLGPGSRRTMKQALRVITGIFSQNKFTDPLFLPWMRINTKSL